MQHSGLAGVRLAGRDWVMGADFSIADISLLGWVRNLIGFYEAPELVGFDRFLSCAGVAQTVASRVRRCSAGWK